MVSNKHNVQISQQAFQELFIHSSIVPNNNSNRQSNPMQVEIRTQTHLHKQSWEELKKVHISVEMEMLDGGCSGILNVKVWLL